MTDEQSDILQDLDDAINWILSGYSEVTTGRLNRIRELLGKLEKTIK